MEKWLSVRWRQLTAVRVGNTQSNISQPRATHTTKSTAYLQHIRIIQFKKKSWSMFNATVLMRYFQQRGKHTLHPWDIEAYLVAGGRCLVWPSARSHPFPLLHSGRQWQNQEHHVLSFLQEKDKISKAQVDGRIISHSPSNLLSGGYMEWVIVVNMVALDYFNWIFKPLKHVLRIYRNMSNPPACL